MRQRVGLVLVTASALVATVLAQPAAAAEQQAGATPQVGTGFSACRVIDFDRAMVLPDLWSNDTTGPISRRVLVVAGYAPYGGMTVSLEPLIYIRQPEYWGIQVIGCMPEIGLPVLTPYLVKLDITATRGTLGIEVVGANKTVRIPLRPVPPKAL